MRVGRPASALYLKGAAFGVAAAAIWAGWSAVTRLAVTTSLDAWDIAALRFGVAGLILAPVVARRQSNRGQWPQRHQERQRTDCHCRAAGPFAGTVVIENGQQSPLQL